MKNAFRILTFLYSCLLIAFIIVMKEEAKNIMWLFYFSIGFTIISVFLLVSFEKIKHGKKALKIVAYILNVLLLALSFLYAFVCLKELLERKEYEIYPITILTSFLIIVVGIVTLLSKQLKATTANSGFAP